MRHTRLLIAGIAAAVLVAFLAVHYAWARCGACGTGKAAAAKAAPAGKTTETLCQCGKPLASCPGCQAKVARLDEALNAIDAAAKAVEGGDHKAALVELTKARRLVADAHQALQPPRPQVANAACPIMGTKLDPAGVPDELTRLYKGRAVGFCCGGCPAAWDKLTDAEKDAKLAKVLAAKPQAPAADRPDE
jgi:hypothetical protein